MSILEDNGLSIEILEGLSFQSGLKKSLKQNLNAFDKRELLCDAVAATDWLDMNPLLAEIAIDYRIKSFESICSKYDRYYPDRSVQKTFNDLLGMRALCGAYKDVLSLSSLQLKIVDMSSGKASDDGYRGVHLYYKVDNFHYPIEIQFNTLRDRQLNDWLHDYVYKKGYPNDLGRELRELYDHGKILTLDDFEEKLEDVLSRCKR